MKSCKTEAGQGISTTTLLDDRQMVTFCFIQLLQTPWTHLLLEIGIYTFASKYQRTQHGKRLQHVCKGCATFLNLSGQGVCIWNCSWHIRYIGTCSREEMMAPSCHLYQGSPGCSQAPQTPRKSAVSRPQPLGQVNTVPSYPSGLWLSYHVHLVLLL